MSTNEQLIFPEIITLNEFGGDFDSFFDEVYSIFSNDFLESNPYFDDLKVTAPRYPEVDGLSRTFYHITHEGKDESNREPDLRRMERIKFPRFKIENYIHKDLLIWEKEVKRDIRIHILNKEQKYLLVLTRRKEYILLWTAFYIEQNHTLKKKIKEYNTYKKAETAQDR